MTRTPALGWLMGPLLAALVGCSASDKPPPATGEDEVKKAFASLQEALKAKDADKIWALLDADSQADAERQATAVRDAYAKADKAGREEMEKTLGLGGKELESVKGVGYLKTKRFLGKHDEIADSKLDKVTVAGDKGTVNYTEQDGDKEKLTFTKVKDGWKVSLAIPKGV
jgi:hypothetical protein